jgi:linoleoyl-CoA desaturase
MSTVKPLYTLNANEDIYQQLRRDVLSLVARLEKKRKKHIVVKAVLFPVAYVFTYLTALMFGSSLAIFYSCYFLLGLQLVFIFLNTIHDAVHNTIFDNKKINGWYVYFFDLMGANSYIWKLRHVRFHHNYPNVDGWDTDIEQSKLFRVFPTGPYSKMHRYQHIYLPLVYPFYLANWLLVRDFKDFFNKKRSVRKLIGFSKTEYVKLFLFKAFFLFYILVLPVMVLPIGWGNAVTGFVIMLFTASIVSLMVLLSPHANIESEFPLPDEDNRLPYSWMMHMLKTTNDVTHDNWFTRIFMGCFNYHVVHHLFPNVNHIYYPEITRLLKEYALKYNLPYRECSLIYSLKNHYRLLKQNRMPENIFEETM